MMIRFDMAWSPVLRGPAGTLQVLSASLRSWPANGWN
jgi:hypothetical protein